MKNYSKNWKRNLLLSLTILLSTSSNAEQSFSFKSPAFSGIGYSSHVQTIENTEFSRKQAIDAARLQAAKDAAAAANNTNLQKFLNNFESRVYAQLSKQLADAMFSATSGTTGTIEFQGTTITWDKDLVSNEVTLTIVSPTGTTTVTVPIASFSF